MAQGMYCVCLYVCCAYGYIGAYMNVFSHFPVSSNSCALSWDPEMLVSVTFVSHLGTI